MNEVLIVGALAHGVIGETRVARAMKGGADERNSRRRVFGLDEGEGEARRRPGVTLATIKATGKETEGLYTLVEVVEPEGAEALLHVHHREDEVFWVLEGELTFEVGEETIKASPGSFLLAPGMYPIATPSTRDPPGCCSSSAARLRGVHLRNQRAGEGERPAAHAGRTAGPGQTEQIGALARQYGCETSVSGSWGGGGASSTSASGSTA